jgi:hypothetical protein
VYYKRIRKVLCDNRLKNTQENMRGSSRETETIRNNQTYSGAREHND